jgi:hypothetical protein
MANLFARSGILASERTPAGSSVLPRFPATIVIFIFSAVL